MKQRVARFLMCYPPLFYFVARSYSFLDSLISKRVTEKGWATRSISIAKSYWNNRNHPSKHFLVERIAAFSPIHNILEVGCSSGPNLYLLAKKFPKAQIVGIDINREAIEHGNAQFAQEGILNVKLLLGKADELGEFQDRAFDLVFTNALCTHIPPDKINRTIKGMLRLTRRVLVLMEPHSFAFSDKELLKLGIISGYSGMWIRDYVTLLRQFVSEEQIRVTKIPDGLWPAKPWKELGAVIEVVMQ